MAQAGLWGKKAERAEVWEMYDKMMEKTQASMPLEGQKQWNLTEEQLHKFKINESTEK